MNIDPIYIAFALPGFIAISSLRLFFDTPKYWNAIQWALWVFFWGVVVFLGWQWGVEKIGFLPEKVKEPLLFSVALSLALFISISILRLLWSILRGVINLSRPDWRI